jgi:hypothetical protein
VLWLCRDDVVDSVPTLDGRRWLWRSERRRRRLRWHDCLRYWRRVLRADVRRRRELFTFLHICTKPQVEHSPSLPSFPSLVSLFLLAFLPPSCSPWLCLVKTSTPLPLSFPKNGMPKTTRLNSSDPRVSPLRPVYPFTFSVRPVFSLSSFAIPFDLLHDPFSSRCFPSCPRSLSFDF